jgi:hypothetical protein
MTGSLELNPAATANNPSANNALRPKSAHPAFRQPAAHANAKHGLNSLGEFA